MEIFLGWEGCLDKGLFIFLVVEVGLFRGIIIMFSRRVVVFIIGIGVFYLVVGFKLVSGVGCRWRVGECS